MLDQREGSNKVQREPFGMLAFYLAILLIVLPTQVDALHSLYYHQRVTEAKIVWGAVFLVVVIPFVISLLRRRWYPGRWEGRTSMVFTACVLVYDVIYAVTFFGTGKGF